jgi:type II restriction/modification system DNA methylase subunit YeeA
MPVNTVALKTFAPAMRRQLIEAVGRKLDLLLHQACADTLTTAAGPIEELRQQEATNRQELLERVAYSWFNRLAALRYLDARLWHPFGARVLMPQTETETQPELLKLLRSGSLPAELQPHTDEARLQGLLDGRLPTAMAGADPQGEVYRELILAVCRSYHQLLPNLFEGLDDASELLLPDDLLSDGSIAGGFRHQISDSDCEDVEIIGWLYQFYISEKKDQVIGKVVKSEDIPAATQLFTPNWIVKYMVQNSLGAQWLATYPASAPKGQMEYYIEPAEQTDDVKAQLAAITPEALNPEELTLIDPACGSGHILVEAYELFKAIYLERGYQQREIPQLILEKNLFGLDIDERAAQLTSFALMMKGRGDDRRLFERGIQLNVMALVNSDGLDVEGLANAINLADHGLKLADLVELKQLFEHATTFGSLIQVPDGLALKLPVLRRLRELKEQDMLGAEALKTLGPLVRQAELLAARYDAVVANPPYMGSRYHNSTIRDFAGMYYPQSKTDIFTMFIDRAFATSTSNGAVAIVAPFVWMFLSSYEKFRRQILSRASLTNLVQLEYNAFEPACVPVAVFAARNIGGLDYSSSCIRLAAFKGHENQKPRTIQAINDPACGWFYTASRSSFEKIPGAPIAYWASKKTIDGFAAGRDIGSLAEFTGSQNWTGDNDHFLRLWWEISDSSRGPDNDWCPYSKGGKYRKWFGNLQWVINWTEKSRAHYATHPSSNLLDEIYWYRDGITYTDITTLSFAGRVLPPGAVYDKAGPSLHTKDIPAVLSYLNSKPASEILNMLNPTMHCQVRDVKALPFNFSGDTISAATSIGERIISLSQIDWEACERSWVFQFLPLLSTSTDPHRTLESSYTTWITNNKQTIAEMKRLEEENNRLFIDAYGLQDELTPDVPIEQITLTVNPAYRYGGNLSEDELWNRFRQDTIKELLSYATGCMMGRYSLDHPGLILANAGDTLENYNAKVSKSTGDLSFQPDRDGIIPVLDGEWFEDDIVARSREFLRVCFPASSLNTDLAFIETALGKDLRKYFCTDFYKDHLQTYKKRPIYWMLQSPAGPAKGGFACLIYLHRYTKDTLNLVLNNYFRPYLQKLEARQAQLGLDQLNDALPTRDRTAARKEAEKITKVLKECQAWEQDSLLPLTQQRIELDLDDGVKVNYLKLQDVLAPIQGLAAKEE